jgi:hypothetical protein
MPQRVGARILGGPGLLARYEVAPDDVAAIRGEGEGKAEDVGVLDGLLQSVCRREVVRLRLYHGDGKIRSGKQQVVSPLPWLPTADAPFRTDAAIGERMLLTELAVR